MRKLFLYGGTLAMGYTVALALAYVGSWFLPEGWPAVIFTIVALWWTWTGFKYAAMRDRVERANKGTG